MKYIIYYLAICGICLMGCQPKQKTQIKATDTLSYTGPLVTFGNVKTYYSENANLKIKLESQLQYSEQNGDVYYPHGAKVTMYEQGIKTTTLKADSAYYQQVSRIYTAIGNVVVMNLTQKQTLKTEVLHWNQAKKEIYTDQAIRIKTQTEILEGIGMTCNEDFSEYVIWKPTGIFTID